MMQLWSNYAFRNLYTDDLTKYEEGMFDEFIW